MQADEKKPACIPHSKHQTSNGDACKLKQTKKTKLRVQIYLVLSVRRVIYTPEECDKC